MIVTNLWFDTQAEEAAEYYCSIFEDARVLKVVPYPEGTDKAGTAMVVEFELLGQRFVAHQRRAAVHASTKPSRCRSSAATRRRSTTTGSS